MTEQLTLTGEPFPSENDLRDEAAEVENGSRLGWTVHWRQQSGMRLRNATAKSRSSGSRKEY